MRLLCNRRGQYSTRHYPLPNRTPSARNGLAAFDLVANGVPYSVNHYRLLPMFLVTL